MFTENSANSSENARRESMGGRVLFLIRIAAACFSTLIGFPVIRADAAEFATMERFVENAKSVGSAKCRLRGTGWSNAVCYFGKEQRSWETVDTSDEVVLFTFSEANIEIPNSFNKTPIVTGFTIKIPEKFFATIGDTKQKISRMINIEDVVDGDAVSEFAKIGSSKGQVGRSRAFSVKQDANIMFGPSVRIEVCTHACRF